MYSTIRCQSQKGPVREGQGKGPLEHRSARHQEVREKMSVPLIAVTMDIRMGPTSHEEADLSPDFY